MARKKAPAKTTTRRKSRPAARPAPAGATATAAPPLTNGRIPHAAGGESLEKVRDILFGSQQRDNDRRFGRIEEQLAADLTALRDEFRKRLDSLEQYARNEVTSLLERLKAEGQRQSQALKDLAALHKEELKNFDRQVTEQVKDLDRRLKAGDDASEKRDGELRKELLDQSGRLRDEVQQSRAELTEALSKAMIEVRDTKLDRASLAGMFTEMAMRLADEAPPRKR